MSMARCPNCDRIFDTDEDPDSTYTTPAFKCESCREEEDEDED